MSRVHTEDRPPAKGDQKAENAEKSRKYEAKDGAKLNGVRRCDGLQEPRFSGRRLGFCTISGPELVWPGGVLWVVASFSSSAEGRYAPDVLQRRPTEDWQLRSLHGPRPNEAQKRRCSGNVAAAVAEPTPLPAKRESKPAVSFSPTETLRDRRQPDGMRRPDAQPSPSPTASPIVAWLTGAAVKQAIAKAASFLRPRASLRTSSRRLRLSSRRTLS